MMGKRLQLMFAISIVLLVLTVGVFIWRGGLWGVLTDQETLEQLVRTLGVWGPGGIVLGEILQVLLAPVPGQMVGIAAGYLYGVFWGTLLCMVGLAIGTLTAIWLARRLGRPLLEKYASDKLIRRVDSYVERRGALAFFLIFLLPFLPDDACCFIAGLTRLRIGELVILAIVGRAPGLIVSTLIGAQARKLVWFQATIIGVVGVALAIFFIRYQERLEQAMFGVLDRLSRISPEGKSLATEHPIHDPTEVTDSKGPGEIGKTNPSQKRGGP